jgi:hypothetical protein
MSNLECQLGMCIQPLRFVGKTKIKQLHVGKTWIPRFFMSTLFFKVKAPKLPVKSRIVVDSTQILNHFP